VFPAARQHKNPVNLFTSRYFFATTPRACAISLLIDSLDFPSFVITRFCSTSLSIDFLSTFFSSLSTFDSNSFSISFFLPPVIPHHHATVSTADSFTANSTMKSLGTFLTHLKSRAPYYVLLMHMIKRHIEANTPLFNSPSLFLISAHISWATTIPRLKHFNPKHFSIHSTVLFIFMNNHAHKISSIYDTFFPEHRDASHAQNRWHWLFGLDCGVHRRDEAVFQAVYRPNRFDHSLFDCPICRYQSLFSVWPTIILFDGSASRHGWPNVCFFRVCSSWK